MLEKNYSKWKKLFVYVSVNFIIYLGFRCLFWAVFPFFVAVLLMKLFYPPALWLKERMKIGKGISVFVLFLIFMGLVTLILWFVLRKLFGQIGQVFQHMDSYEQYVNNFLYQCCCRMEQYFGLRAEYTKPYLLGNFYNLTQTIRNNISDGIMTYSYQYAKGFIKVIGIFVVIMVASVLLAKDYDKLRGQLERSSFYENVKKIKDKVFYAIFIYLRAQLLIMICISALCITVLFFMKVENALFFGFGIGLLDALPFLGTGSVLIPWALIQLFSGKWLSAALLGSLYLVCSFVREFLEPKLIGKKLGVLPIYVVAAVYIGLVLYGVAGVLLGPLQALLSLEIGRQWIEEHS